MAPPGQICPRIEVKGVCMRTIGLGLGFGIALLLGCMGQGTAAAATPAGTGTKVDARDKQENQAPGGVDPETLRRRMVLQRQADSLAREVTRGLLTDLDKRDIRTCDSAKRVFLQDLRQRDTNYAHIDNRLRQAKLNRADPNSNSVRSLLEAKFRKEERFEQTYLATLPGAGCHEKESKRYARIQAALNVHAEYQSLQDRLAAP